MAITSRKVGRQEYLESWESCEMQDDVHGLEKNENTSISASSAKLESPNHGNSLPFLREWSKENKSYTKTCSKLAIVNVCVSSAHTQLQCFAKNCWMKKQIKGAVVTRCCDLEEFLHLARMPYGRRKLNLSDSIEDPKGYFVN